MTEEDMLVDLVHACWGGDMLVSMPADDAEDAERLLAALANMARRMGAVACVGQHSCMVDGTVVRPHFRRLPPMPFVTSALDWTLSAPVELPDLALPGEIMDPQTLAI